MNTLGYAPDGQIITTGGDDGKVEVWSTHSGICFVTFAEHIAPISVVAFAMHGSVLSLDGTVRGYDLVRYPNFRMFTAPSPVQFPALAVGEVVAARSTDSFEDTHGPRGPRQRARIIPGGAHQLASGSWAAPSGSGTSLGAPAQWSRWRFRRTCSRSRPDGKELAAATLDGQIAFFDVDQGKQTNVIEEKECFRGRKVDDRVSAANSGKAYNSLAYTADGRCILAGGNSEYVVLYDVREGEGVLVKKFQPEDEAGISTDLIDTCGDGSDLEDRLDASLPGASRRHVDSAASAGAATKCMRFSPTGRARAATSTEELLVYSFDDPLDLSLGVTPQAVLAVLAAGEHLKALVMVFRLGRRRRSSSGYTRLSRAVTSAWSRAGCRRSTFSYSICLGSPAARDFDRVDEDAGCGCCTSCTTRAERS
ncbi:WD40-repeat-containing domain protein [Mycena pura]|uniref:WD40-repeat-containing domain protein n=1 Tax=Mycena pura TaxID=153505 RepID=A0AAD6VJ75_9AGAR|nr:WD40-repeat-containing domain protein [Mycena pura]